MPWTSVGEVMGRLRPLELGVAGGTSREWTKGEMPSGSEAPAERLGPGAEAAETVGVGWGSPPPGGTHPASLAALAKYPVWYLGKGYPVSRLSMGGRPALIRRSWKTGQ